ncbi:hypothetical protein EYF80_054281 [Liparis tanakae]|uniref:Uncharacterized protein n=1 Tax=Liparis tanakae TaxID=230148 RepID=A0A4Z2F337_9TELE|nr:hypothetical protein EYF80_054281 [Liparis tanakae]
MSVPFGGSRDLSANLPTGLPTGQAPPGSPDPVPPGPSRFPRPGSPRPLAVPQALAAGLHGRRALCLRADIQHIRPDRGAGCSATTYQGAGSSATPLRCSSITPPLRGSQQVSGGKLATITFWFPAGFSK